MNVRQAFDLELEELSSALIRMGVAATDAVGKAITALDEKNEELARQIMAGDSVIDEMERSIEQRCLRLLLKQQPVAGDLRKISTAIKMITDIERIGDAASDIAEISIQMEKPVPHEISLQLKSMAKAASEMATDAIDAYVKENLDMAMDVKKRDDIVDDYFIEIRGKLGRMMIENNEEMEAAMDCLMIIKYLERIGDHAVNIGEWVEFYRTGVHKKERIL